MVVRLFFDTCAFHPPVPKEKEASDRLLDLEEKEGIEIIIPFGTYNELPNRLAKFRSKMISTNKVPLVDEEEKVKLEISTILFSNKPQLQPNEATDIDNLFEALKYGCTFFVTFDKKHILSRSLDLQKRFNLRVASPSECLKYILSQTEC